VGLCSASSNKRPNVDWDNDKTSNDVPPIQQSKMALANQMRSDTPLFELSVMADEDIGYSFPKHSPKIHPRSALFWSLTDGFLMPR